MNCPSSQTPADSVGPRTFLDRARLAVTGLLPKIGGAGKTAASEVEEFLPIVELAPAQATQGGDTVARADAAHGLPGFDDAKQLLVEAIASRADRLIIETSAVSEVWYEVDGVRLKPLRAKNGKNGSAQEVAWVEAEPLSRDAGLAVAHVLRTLSGLSGSGRRQTGEFEFTIDRAPTLGRVAADRLNSGERMTIDFVKKQKSPAKLVETGMPEAMRVQLAEIMDHDSGLLILSSPPANGLTTSLDLLVEASDRLLRDFVAIMNRDRLGREIVNLTPMFYGHGDDPKPADVLKAVIHKNVGVIVAPDVRDKDFLVDLVTVGATKAMVLLSIKAVDATEAIRRVMKCGIDAKKFASVFRGSLSQRLVRRLCPRCRSQAHAAVVDAGRQGIIEPTKQVFVASRYGCQLCRGLGYRDRIGIFELASGGELRRAIAAGGGSNHILRAALKGGMQPLRAVGSRLVVDGVTSTAEVDRMLAPPLAEQDSRSSC